MLIKKDFDQLKEILSDPEKAERLIAYSGPTLEISEYKKVDIRNITENVIEGTYTHGKYHYVIKFSRNTDNHIEYTIGTSRFGYWFFFLLILAVIFKHDTSIILVFPLIIFLVIYLVNNQIKVGIYNRVNKRWDEFTKVN